MDIYNYLKKDHRKINNLFAHIISSKSLYEKEALLETLKNEFFVHTETEHNTFYKALKHALPKQIEHANQDHKDIKKAIAKLEGLSPENSDWLIRLGELQNIIKHHFEEEEGEIFDAAKKILSEKKAKELAEEMEALKAEILETV